MFRAWLGQLADRKRWRCWIMIWAPGVLLCGVFLGALPNPEGRWYRTLGVPSHRYTKLTADAYQGQPIVPLPSSPAFLGLRFRLSGPKTDATVELRLLAGPRPPREAEELRSRTMARVVVSHRSLRQDRFHRWEFTSTPDLSRGAYLLVRLARAPHKPGKTDKTDKTGDIGLWLDDRPDPPESGGLLLRSGDGPSLSQVDPLGGQLVMEAGHPGRPTGFWASLLLARWWGAPALLLALLFSLAFVVLLAPRPRELLRQVWASLRKAVLSGERPHRGRQWIIPLAMVMVTYVVLLLHKAWITDDAFLTLRTVHNFTDGHGLIWNPDDRVQVYTHPLWMLVESLLYWPTKNAYLASMVPSLIIGPLVVLLLMTRVAATGRAAITVAAMLLLSSAFMDFNTSGLENPMTHLLLVCFAALFVLPRQTAGTFLLQVLLASFALLNRMDTILLFLPALAATGYAVIGRGEATPRELLRLGLLGLGPFLAWELFSLFYYGFPFPNTAYAKLASGIPRKDLALQGLLYLLNSIAWDPPTLATLFGSLAIPVVLRQPRLWALVIGAWLYVAYVISVGGDFMAGRFLSAPLLLAVVVWARLPMEHLRTMAAPLATLTGLCIFAHFSPLYQDRGLFGDLGKGSGIVDERDVYYKERGLLPRMLSKERFGVRPDKKRREKVKVMCGAAGLRGFNDGHKTPLVDPCALGDAFLARLPAQGAFTSLWRIGHFTRFLPMGYRPSLASGQNLLSDRDLSRYYDRMIHLTRGDLFDPARLWEIIRFNVGSHDHLLEVFTPKKLELEELAAVKKDGLLWNQQGNTVLNLGGVEVDLGERRFHRRIELSAHRSGSYLLILVRRGRGGFRKTLESRPGTGLVTHRFVVPDKARDKGYAKIRVLPLKGDGRFSIGHLKLHQY